MSGLGSPPHMGDLASSTSTKAEFLTFLNTSSRNPSDAKIVVKAGEYNLLIQCKVTIEIVVRRGVIHDQA